MVSINRETRTESIQQLHSTEGPVQEANLGESRQVDSSFEVTSRGNALPSNGESIVGKPLGWEAGPIESLLDLRQQLADATFELEALATFDRHLQRARSRVAKGFEVFDAAQESLNTLTRMVEVPLPAEPTVLEKLLSNTKAERQVADRNRALANIETARRVFFAKIDAVCDYLVKEPSIRGEDIHSMAVDLSLAKTDWPRRTNRVDEMRRNLESAKQGFEKAIYGAAMRDCSNQRNVLQQNIAILSAKIRTLQFEVDPATPLTADEAAARAQTSLGGSWKVDKVLDGSASFTVFLVRNRKDTSPWKITEERGGFAKFAKTVMERTSTVYSQTAVVQVARSGGTVLAQSVGQELSFQTTTTETI